LSEGTEKNQRKLQSNYLVWNLTSPEYFSVFLPFVII